MHPTDIIDTLPRRRRRRPFTWIVIAILLLFAAGGTLLSFYVDALWFDSLGYGQVFWRTLSLQATVAAAFGIATFLSSIGGFLALEPPELASGGNGGFIMINDRPVRVPVGPVLRFLAGVFSAANRAGDRREDGRRLADVRALVVQAGPRRRASVRRRTAASIRFSAGRSRSICSRCRRGRRSPAGS